MIVNSRISNDQVVDVGQNYDTRFFRNETFPDGTIPAGESPAYYRRVNASTVQRLTDNQIEAIDHSKLAARLKTESQALVTALIADIQALQASPQRQIFTQMLQLIRKLTLLSKLE